MKRVALAFVALSACATSHPKAEEGTFHIFNDQKLAIIERTATGFTAEAQLTLDNPGPGTIQVRGATAEVFIGERSVTKLDLRLEQTAEVGERQGLTVPIKVDLGADGAARLGGDSVLVRAIGTLHVSQGKERDLPFICSIEVRGSSLVVR